MAQGGHVVFVSSGTPVTGGWCGHCLLSSLVRVPVWVTSKNGCTPLGTVDACTECGDGMPGRTG